MVKNLGLRSMIAVPAAVALLGGAYFAAKGSGWHVDGGPQLADFSTKFLMTRPGLDRCSTIGFRCMVDLP